MYDQPYWTWLGTYLVVHEKRDEYWWLWSAWLKRTTPIFELSTEFSQPKIESRIKTYFDHEIAYNIYYRLLRLRSNSIKSIAGFTIRANYNLPKCKAFQQSIFLTCIDMQRPNYFEFSVILLYWIDQIIYIIINYPNNFSITPFFLHRHRNFKCSKHNAVKSGSVHMRQTIHHH